MFIVQATETKEPSLPDPVDVEMYAPENPIKVVLISGSIAASSSINYLLTQMTSF